MKNNGLPGYLLGHFFFNQFVDNSSTLLLCEKNVFDVLDMVDDFRFLLCHEVLSFWLKWWMDDSDGNVRAMYIFKSVWNTMECKRDSFIGALSGARETHREYVSHHLNLLGLAPKMRWLKILKKFRNNLWSLLTYFYYNFFLSIWCFLYFYWVYYRL